MSTYFSFSTYDALSIEYPFNNYNDYLIYYTWETYDGKQNLIAETAAQYQQLLILQYIGKTRASNTVDFLATQTLLDLIPSAVSNAFNLNALFGPTSIGVQLDLIGEYVGVTRSGYVNNQFITLDDADFMKLIQIAIIKNTTGTSLADIQISLAKFFPGGQILVFDSKSMSLSYLVRSTIGSNNLLSLFISEGLLPRPMGVGISSIVVLDQYWSCCTYTNYAATTTASFSNTDTTITVGSATGIVVGMFVFGIHIPVNTQVTSISGTTIGISKAAIGSDSGNYIFEYTPLNDYASYQLTYPFLSFADGLNI